MTHRRRMADHPTAPQSGPSADTTLTLLERARAGDRAAIDALFARCLPPLLRWSRGRLPKWARDLADTQDVVRKQCSRR
ncbi:MAG: hypothetical protein ACT4QD_24670 [Acidobacteriota bacterium]